MFLPNTGGILALLVPTAPTHWTISEVQADPIAKNSALGHFAHFANVIDLCAVALPASTFPVTELSGQIRGTGVEEGKEARLPFGVTLLGPRFADNIILDLGESFLNAVNERTRQQKIL